MRGDPGVRRGIDGSIMEPADMVLSVKRVGTFLLILLLGAAPRLHASAIPPSPLSAAKLTVLPNGLRVIIAEQHSAPLVAVDAWVRAGSGREGPAESGAAHFLEHLLFKGTATRKPGEVDAAIEDLGATLAAGTMRDAAHFYTTVARQYLPSALDVIADVLQNAALAPEEVERERAVILDEMAIGRGDTPKQVINALYERLAANHPYRNPILGRPDSLRTLSRDTIAAYYHRWYAPNNATVVVVGDIDTDAAVTAVAKAFASWARRELPPVPTMVADAYAKMQPSIVSLPARGDGRTVVATGYLIPAPTSLADIAAGLIMNEFLYDESIGRIPLAMRDAGANAEGEPPGRPVRSSTSLGNPKKEWLTDLAADYTPLREPAILACWAAVDPDQLGRFSRLELEAVHRLQKDVVSADELQYAKRRVIGSYLFATETVGGQARALGSYDVLGDYRFAGDLVGAVNAMKPADITALALRCLNAVHRVEFALIPEKR